MSMVQSPRSIELRAKVRSELDWDDEQIDYALHLGMSFPEMLTIFGAFNRMPQSSDFIGRMRRLFPLLMPEVD